ncbi:MAG: hypothetical protein ACJ0F4_01930 [Gammaproteobacteria bacterium]
MDYEEAKSQTNKRLLRFAWGLEIFFCIAGLLIAFSLAFSGLSRGEEFSSISFNDWLGFGVVGIVLCAIALTELVKIPTVQGILYAESLKTKVLCSLFLMAICFLTFETMTQGLEQNIANREIAIEKPRIKLLSFNERSDLVDKEINTLNTITPEQIKKSAKNGLESQLLVLDGQISDLENRLTSLVSPKDSAEVTELKRQIASLKQAKKESKDLYIQEQSSLSGELANLNENEQKELGNAFFKGSIKSNYEKRRSSIVNRKKDLDISHREEIADYELLIDQLGKKILTLTFLADESQDEITEINATIQKLNQEKGRLIEQSNKTIERDLIAHDRRTNSIEVLLAEKGELLAQAETMRNQINIESNKSFIHRIAARIFGIDSAADLTKEQVSLVSLIFIISVASIVSISGPIMAFMSVSNSIEQANIRKKSGTRGTFRRVLVDLRKRLRKPKVVTKTEEKEVIKEVLKEVPVDKTVYKTIEVPTPVEVTRFVGVPVPTEPKNLPEFNSAQEGQFSPMKDLIGLAK